MNEGWLGLHYVLKGNPSKLEHAHKVLDNFEKTHVQKRTVEKKFTFIGYKAPIVIGLIIGTFLIGLRDVFELIVQGGGILLYHLFG